MNDEIELLKQKIHALRSIAFYEGHKFPWEVEALANLGEKREDYLEFLDPDDLTDEEYETLYGKIELD